MSSTIILHDQRLDGAVEPGLGRVISVNGTTLGEGDGAAVSGEDRLRFLGRQPAEVLVFDLA